MCNNNYTVRFVKSDSDEFETVKQIRTAVFTEEQGADAKTEFDSFDSSSDFVLLYTRDEPVGTARLVMTDKGWKIGRIAILKAHRGKGLGNLIVRAVLDRAFERGADTVYVDAQNYAVPFYEKIGFRVIGAELYDRGLPHMPMVIEKENYYGR